MACTPKPVRREKKRTRWQTRFAKRVVREIRNEERGVQPRRKQKAWRKWHAKRQAFKRRYGYYP